VQAGEIERGADEGTVDQANEELTAEIRDDVFVDLFKDGGDFVFQRRVAQGQIFAPAFLDSGALFQKEEKIDRHHHQAEKDAGDAEETANALFEQRPNFFADVRQL